MNADSTNAEQSARKQVIVEVFGKSPHSEIAILQTETRHSTIQGCGGHYQCRRVPVTLPYSGTIQ